MRSVFYIQGELYQTVPLCRTEDSVDTETGYMTIREESDLRVEDIDPEKCGLTDAVKRIYHASAYFEGDLDDSGYDLVSLANYQIVNTETEEVLFDYSSYERPMHFLPHPAIQVRSLREKRPDFIGVCQLKKLWRYQKR